MKNEGFPFNGDSFMKLDFLKLKEKGFNTVVETGTYHGDTTEWLCDNFDKVYTS